MKERKKMVKWRYMWNRFLLVAITVMALAVASGAGHQWD
jgi:hypothetical protein